ncbi:MAG: flagellar assembly protein FliX [Alphaproteobacteria bacterium]|nr:flagellar assembly protein FliX [Alphaproteobacteria bacterium]
MKVEGPRSSQSVSGAKKAGAAKKSGGASFSDALSETGSAEAGEASAQAGAAGPASAVDALLALQEVDAAGDATSGRKNRRAIARGQEILDGLEEIRTGLLLGAIPIEKLERLAAVSAERGQAVDDPKLASILADIELRARVELAKYRSA